MSQNNQNYQIPVMNMTGFFHRELMMYSIGDIRFPKPISLKKVAYIAVMMTVWTLPHFLIFGLIMNPIYLIWIFVPPILIGEMFSRPVFGGRTLIDFAKTMISFALRPKCWTDLKASNLHKGDQIKTSENEIWVSRRRELQHLARQREERNKLYAQERAKNKSPKRSKKSKRNS